MPDILSTDFSEPGFLKRLRNWRDAMPWLVLSECLHPATSLVALVLSLAALFAGSWGAFALERLIENRGYTVRPSASSIPVEVPMTGTVALLPKGIGAIRGPSPVGTHEYMTGPLRTLTSPDNDGRVTIVRLLQQFWLFSVWIIPAGYVMRQSSLAVAGRERMTTVDTLKLVLRRSLSFLSGPALTIGVALLVCLYFILLGYVDRIPAIGHALSSVGGLLGLPLVLMAGLLVFGTILSFPLMWSSVVTEPFSDGFDAASRGFEYILQRPFRFVAYVFMCTILSIIAINLVSGVVSMGFGIASSAFSTTATTRETIFGNLSVAQRDSWPIGSLSILMHIPTAFAFNLFWSFSTGIYLLLRRDANHQDVVEVWEPEQPKSKPLPDMDRKSEKSESEDASSNAKSSA